MKSFLTKSSVLVYTVSRLLLFAVVLGVVWLLGFRSFLGVLVALVISGILSYIVLSGQRDAMSTQIRRRAATMRERIADGAAREDDD
jgi:hypothetical protein